MLFAVIINEHIKAADILLCKGGYPKHYDMKLFKQNDRTAVWQLTEDKHLKVQRRQDVTVFPDMFMLQRNILPFF